MDLLVECFDKGWLTDESLIDFLRCHVDYDFNAPAKKTILCTTQTTSGSTLGAAGISQIVDTWKKTVNPVYAQDVSAREDANRLFVALSAVAALKRVGRNQVPAAIMKDIPAEIQKSLQVVTRPSFGGQAMKDAIKEAQARAKGPNLGVWPSAALWVGGGVAVGLLIRAMQRGSSPSKAPADPTDDHRHAGKARSRS